MKKKLPLLGARFLACQRLIRLLALIALLGPLPGFVFIDRAESPPENLVGPAPEAPSPEQRPAPRSEPGRGIYKAQIKPHWFLNNTRFWYRNDLPRGAKEFILVDAERGARQPAFDHQRLAAALSKAAAGEFAADHPPFTDIEFVEDGKAIRFDAARRSWQCDLNSYACLPLPSDAEAKPAARVDPAPTPAPTPPPRDAARSGPLGVPSSPAPPC